MVFGIALLVISIGAIVAGRLPQEIVYADDAVLDFLCEPPATEGHLLVVPRTHRRDIWTIPRDEAGAYIKTYFERFPGIRTYMDRMQRQVRAEGFVTTIFGRKIYIPAAQGRSQAERSFGDRAAINAPIQGAAADVMRRAMIRMPGALREAGLTAKMLLQVHDELIFEVPEKEVAATLPVVQHVMQDAPFPAVLLSVPLHVDARAADNWDEAH